MSRTCGTIFDDSSNEIVYGIVARTHSAPSSSFGMNSAPMCGMNSIDSANTADAMRDRPPRTPRARARGHARIAARIHSYAGFRRSRTPRRRNHAQSTGRSVNVTISAPMSAKIVVSAIGSNSFPDGPFST